MDNSLKPSVLQMNVMSVTRAESKIALKPASYQGCLEFYDFGIKQSELFFRIDPRNTSEQLIN